MNEIFNKNFFTGLLAVARDLQDQKERLVVGVIAGQSKSVLGAVLPKILIDKRLELEAQKTAAENELKKAETKITDLENALTSADAKIDFLERAIGVEVDIPANNDPSSAKLAIVGATPKWSVEPSSLEITRDGSLKIPRATEKVSIFAENDGGVTRKMELTLNRLARPT